MLILSLLGCSKLATIDVSESSQVVVEGSSIVEDLLGQLGFEEFVTMDLTNAQELKNQGVEPEDIHEVHLISMELEAMSPDGADLSFFEDMAFSVAAEGLPTEDLAWASEFPEGAGLVTFELAELDLAPYVLSQAMTLETDVTARRPDEDTTVEARFTLAVDVTTRGVKKYVEEQ